MGREVPDSEQLYARKLWADFSFPRFGPDFDPIRKRGRCSWEGSVAPLESPDLTGNLSRSPKTHSPFACYTLGPKMITLATRAAIVTGVSGESRPSGPKVAKISKGSFLGVCRKVLKTPEKVRDISPDHQKKFLLRLLRLVFFFAILGAEGPETPVNCGPGRKITQTCLLFGN